MVFGAGSLEKLPEEIDKLGATRALVLCTPEQRAMGADIAAMLGARSAGVFDGAVMHVPLEVAEAARNAARRLHVDCCVAIGGGSTTGLAKAIALTAKLPILAIPTTYAGSEMTPIWGITEGGVKKTGRDVRRPAQDGDLRSCSHDVAAGGAVGHQRDQRHRALRRGAVLAGCQSDHLADRRRGNSGAGGRSSGRS